MIQIGNSNLARTVGNSWIGVNNIARNIVAGWIGVNNVARPFLLPPDSVFFTNTIQTSVWNVPQGINKIWISAIAGGGGSGSATSANSSPNVSCLALGGGGGSGGMITNAIYDVTPGQLLTIFCGAGGANGAYTYQYSFPSPGPNGSVGGNTTINFNDGRLITLTGGGGGGGSKVTDGLHVPAGGLAGSPSGYAGQNGGQINHASSAPLTVIQPGAGISLAGSSFLYGQGGWSSGRMYPWTLNMYNANQGAVWIRWGGYEL